jgi:hypothetical protein
VTTPAEAPRPLTAAERRDTVVVVTGLPRAGTSLMMQLLEAAGLPPFADDRRPADESNPRGYYEHAAAKAIARDARFVADARGRALKVVAPLLSHLPEPQGEPHRLRYAAVWMERDLGEVLASQAAMLERLGQSTGGDDALLRRGFERQLAAGRAALAERGAPVLTVSHAALLAGPDRVAAEVCRFLGGDLDARAAASVVDPVLHRARRGA